MRQLRTQLLLRLVSEMSKTAECDECGKKMLAAIDKTLEGDIVYVGEYEMEVIGQQTCEHCGELHYVLHKPRKIEDDEDIPM